MAINTTNLWERLKERFNGAKILVVQWSYQSMRIEYPTEPDDLIYDMAVCLYEQWQAEIIEYGDVIQPIDEAFKSPYPHKYIITDQLQTERLE